MHDFVTGPEWAARADLDGLTYVSYGWHDEPMGELFEDW